MTTPSTGNLFNRMLDFNQMIGGSLIRIIYFVGLVGIAVYALMLLVSGLGVMAYSPLMGLAMIIGAAATVVFGAIMWRFTCELWILLFKIHDRLVEIRDGTKPVAPTAGPRTDTATIA